MAYRYTNPDGLSSIDGNYPATGKWDWDFTNWFSKDKPGWMLGMTINTSFTNTTFFASMNWSNGSNTTLGYNTQYGWGGGSAPQNMYFPDESTAVSEATAVSNISSTLSNYNQISAIASNYMDRLSAKVISGYSGVNLPGIEVVWNGKYGSGRIVGNMPGGYSAEGHEGYNFGRTNNAFSIAGLGWGIMELSLYNDNFWLGKNLKYYSTISWKYGNQWTGSSFDAMKIARPAKFLGRMAFGVNLIYGGYNTFSGIANGDYSKATFSGLGTIYSGIATYGGVPGIIIAGPMVLIDSTIGLDNFWQNGVNLHIERANRISQGDNSMMWYTPGRTIR